LGYGRTDGRLADWVGVTIGWVRWILFWLGDVTRRARRLRQVIYPVRLFLYIGLVNEQMKGPVEGTSMNSMVKLLADLCATSAFQCLFKMSLTRTSM